MSTLSDHSTISRSHTDRVRDLLTAIVPGNAFYARKLAEANVTPADLRTPGDFARLPFTSKADLATDQAEHPPHGTNLSYPVERYTRLHQTSGTSTGRPLRWLDTADSWEAMLGHWREYLTGWMGLDPGRDRAFFAFSFGPFLGFWTAFESARSAGFLCLPGGGMPTTARLRFLLDNRATAVFATPTYALHLAEVAVADRIDLASSEVRAVIVAGEPGGCLPGTRDRIERAWGARVFDQYGLTEVGPAATEPAEDPGNLAVLSDDYIAEVLQPGSAEPAPPGEVGELVITNLHRLGSPLIRYRTGDLVRPAPGPRPDRHPRLLGGVLGRTDDMIHLRGNNVFPAAIERVVRRFPEVAEFRLVVSQRGPLADLLIELEPVPAAQAGAGLADAVRQAIRDELLFRPDVALVSPGSLPRFEMKSRRVVKTEKSN